MKFVTLRLRDLPGSTIAIKMPAATLGYRAAQKCAEALGYDPEDGSEWRLVALEQSDFVVDDEPVVEFDGKVVVLLRRSRRSL